jgi:hypothetical protein
LEFIEALRVDWEESRKTKDPDWANPDLGLFLDAMKSWVDDMGDLLSDNADWKLFAQMFRAGKSYE